MTIWVFILFYLNLPQKFMEVYESQRVSPAARSLLPADDLPSKDSSWGACYGRSLGIIPDISQKYKMGDIQ
jgi:hypothetical protein